MYLVQSNLDYMKYKYFIFAISTYFVKYYIKSILINL